MAVPSGQRRLSASLYGPSYAPWDRRRPGGPDSP
jgi:hypothetical protein